jgi:3-phenylpropionate/trans-cinnamate dioxygenase ferredoxin reductase subunit
MQVTLIERDSRILGRVASAETAAYFKALHQRQGVAVREGVELASLERLDGRVVAVQLGDGISMETDVVIAGIGVIPETSIARCAGLRVGDGIMVDSAGRTDDTSIYALGDCACFPWRGRRIRLESVQNAVDMADVVAQAIIGKRVSYQSIPWFWSDQYSTKLQIAGLNHGYAQVAVRKASEDSMSIWYYDEQQMLIAVDAINDAKAFMTARRWLGEGVSPSIEEIGNISVPLSSIALSEQTDQIT